MPGHVHMTTYVPEYWTKVHPKKINILPKSRCKDFILKHAKHLRICDALSYFEKLIRHDKAWHTPFRARINYYDLDKKDDQIFAKNKPTKTILKGLFSIIAWQTLTGFKVRQHTEQILKSVINKKNKYIVRFRKIGHKNSETASFVESSIEVVVIFPAKTYHRSTISFHGHEMVALTVSRYRVDAKN